MKLPQLEVSLPLPIFRNLVNLEFSKYVNYNSKRSRYNLTVHHDIAPATIIKCAFRKTYVDARWT